MNDVLHKLVASIDMMASRESNPVLEVIPTSGKIAEDKHYPEPGILEFNHSGWRAYYHCHPGSRDGKHRFAGEHGHFHLFTRLASSNEWSHVAALAMDNMGQPLGWFTVNQWVTGESWGEIDELIARLQSISFDGNLSVIESWILAYTYLSYETITDLLHDRDLKIRKFESESGDPGIRQNRDIYLLNEMSFNYQDIMSNYNSLVV